MRFLVALLAPILIARLSADGFFVAPPFRYDKARDISEPTQKAILFHDAGRETMVLQVRYSGPVTEFGWIVPVPSRPEVDRATMRPFYELSELVQRQNRSRSRIGSGAANCIRWSSRSRHPSVFTRSRFRR